MISYPIVMVKTTHLTFIILKKYYDLIGFYLQKLHNP